MTWRMEAICEAAQRPGMRFVPVKDEAGAVAGVVGNLGGVVSGLFNEP